jgi:hypothetical protein
MDLEIYIVHVTVATCFGNPLPNTPALFWWPVLEVQKILFTGIGTTPYKWLPAGSGTGSTIRL